MFWDDTEEKRAFEDRFGDAQAYPRVVELYRVLKKSGSFYYHCDWHASHYVKQMLDDVFGFNNFQNEIIWWYRGGGVSKKRFGRRHGSIFLYTKGNDRTFNVDEVRTPYSEQSHRPCPSPDFSRGQRIRRPRDWNGSVAEHRPKPGVG